MKRIAIVFAALVALSAGIAAQPTIVQPLVVKDARSIAMGGAFDALSSGYQSLYGNPAGFAVGRGMLTLANASMWGFFRPDTDALKGLGDDPMATLLSQVSTNNGVGGGAALGLGYTGGGLGLGLTAVSEDYIHGATIAGAQLTSITQLNAIAGMAITLGPKNFNLKIGGDLRPFARIDSTQSATSLIQALAGGGSDPSALIMAYPANYGLSLAADLGLIASMNELSAGLSVRDITPPFGFGATTIGDILGKGGSSASTDTQGQFLPDVSVGLSYSPRLIPYILEPSFYLELQDPVNAIANKESVWNLLHMGGELKLLSFVYLRGGLNQGWMTAGLGLDLLILQLDGAVFTEELGRHPGDFPRSGVAVNLRIHL